MPIQILQFCHNLNCTGVKIYKWQKRNNLSILIATTYSKGIIHKRALANIMAATSFENYHETSRCA